MTFTKKQLKLGTAALLTLILVIVAASALASHSSAAGSWSTGEVAMLKTGISGHGLTPSAESCVIGHIESRYTPEQLAKMAAGNESEGALHALGAQVGLECLKPSEIKSLASQSESTGNEEANQEPSQEPSQQTGQEEVG